MTTLADYFKIYRRRGFWRLIAEFRENLWFDLRRGVNTQTVFHRKSYNAGTDVSPKLSPYVPSFQSPVLNCFAHLTGDIKGRNFTFFDIGCGKGKVLILAAESGLFKKIVGLEINLILAEIAEQNVCKLGMADQIEVIGEDAISYMRYAKRSVLFLYNPFDENMFATFIQSLERTDIKEIYLVYFDPIFEYHLDQWREFYATDWRDDSWRKLKIFHRYYGSLLSAE